MLIKESEYLKELIFELPKSNLKILNFGSQSSKFLKSQSYIVKNIINTATTLGHSITNLDIRNVDGVDIVGDIFDDDFFSKLKSMNFNVIFVFNLLEHVTHLELMISRIQELVSEGNYIIFSGPFKYPVHYDPIDNLFRPSIDDVSKLFKECDFIKGNVVRDYKYIKYLFNSPKSFFLLILRTMTFFYRYDKWKKVVIPKYKWMFRNYETTCVLFQKKCD
jgi:hypothetical protein